MPKLLLNALSVVQWENLVLAVALVLESSNNFNFNSQI